MSWSCRPGKGGAVGPEALSHYVDVALGRRDPDLLVTNGQLVDVYTREIHEGASVAVAGCRIARVDLEGHPRAGSGTRVIDARGRAILPGFMDAHTHVFDWLYNVDEAVKYAMMHGVTTIVTETEDIFYQCGHGCFLPLLNSLLDQPIKIYATLPPIATYDEESAEGLPEGLFDELLGRDYVLGLGETYWQFLLGDGGRFLGLYSKALSAGKSVEGHSAGAKGAKLQAYAAAGVSSCHEPVTSEEVLERLRAGMHVMIREGSVRRDLRNARAALLSGMGLENVSLVSDSMSPVDLLRRGYMDAIVQEAIDMGLDPVDAVRMVTINPARHFRLDGAVGGVAPGRCADLVLVPNPGKIVPEVVVSNGSVVFADGIRAEPRRPRLERCRGCLRLPRGLSPDDFMVAAEGPVTVRVVDYVTDLVTKEARADMSPVGGYLEADPGRDLLKASVVAVGGGPAGVFTGFVRGFGIAEGALAITNQWDSSGMVVLGADEPDMALAANRAAEMGGGIAFFRGGAVRFELPLPIMGMIADLPVEDLSSRLSHLQSLLEDAGTRFRDALLSLETITSPAIPFIRISSRGLVDVKSGRLLELLVGPPGSELPTSSS